MLDLLIEDTFDPLAHLGDRVLRPVEQDAIREDEADVLNELLNIVVTRVGWVWIGLAGI